MGISSLSFGLPFFLRVVLPGAVAAVAALPLIGPPLEHALTLLGLASDTSRVVLVSVLTLGLGLVLWALDDPMYEVLEGRRWPRVLRDALTARWQRHVDRLLEREQQLDKTTAAGAAENDEIWYELRQFPFDDQQVPVARMPTKVGNILSAYEQYPGQRYGMDAVFYWPRLALLLDKDTREEIDRHWAGADAWMHIAGALLGVGVIYVLVGGVALMFPLQLQWACFSWARPEWWFGGVLLIVTAYVPYRLSWAFHLRNGERFKAAFDLYGRKLAFVEPISESERTNWRNRWFELQYGEPRKPKRPAASAPTLVASPAAAPAALPGILGRIHRLIGLIGPRKPIVRLFWLDALGISLAIVSGLPQGSSGTVDVLMFALLVAGTVVGPSLNLIAGVSDLFVTVGRLTVPSVRDAAVTTGCAFLLLVTYWWGAPAARFALDPPHALAAGLSAGALEEIVARVLLLGGALGAVRLAAPKRAGSTSVRVTVLLASALAFAALHYATGGATSPVSLIQYTVAGLLLGVLYLRFGLGAAIAAHGMADAVIYMMPIC